MPITAICNHCGASYTVAEDNIGRTAKCKNCQQPFTIAPSSSQPLTIASSGSQPPPSAPAGVQDPATQAPPPPDAVSSTMMVRCPHCEVSFSLARQFVGHEINCLKCGVTFTPSKSGISEGRKNMDQITSNIAISGLDGSDEEGKSSGLLSKWPTLMAFGLVAVFLIIFLIMIYKPS